MLHFLTMADNKGPIRRYLRWWGGPLRGRARILSYDSIADPAALADGAYIFGDVDRLTGPALDHARRVWDALETRGGPRVRLLNKPGVALKRRELLKALHAHGLNQFNVHDLDAPRDGLRYPVFIRHSREHHGSYTEILQDRAQLEAAERDLIVAGHDPRDLLIVEYLDTSEDGLFRKYSAMRVGNEVLPHHAFLDRKWVVKGSFELPDARPFGDDRAFLVDHDHVEALREVFDLAHMEFGRIDYAIKDGRIQVWEINTVPHMLISKRYYDAERMQEKEIFADKLNSVFAALDPVRGVSPIGRALAWSDLWRS
jgi:hypothetical protein